MFSGKEEENGGHLPKLKSSVAAPTITSWSRSRSKDPRIVRVSRAFGSKDRHSKVCTVKGLRDRRVRLSIPTAIQLYDLQERLNLGQPSKVVDWLLDAAKKDIDELPPLQIPQEMLCWPPPPPPPENDDVGFSDQGQMSCFNNGGGNNFFRWGDSFGGGGHDLEHGFSVVQLQPCYVAQQMSAGFYSGGGSGGAGGGCAAVMPVNFLNDGNGNRFHS